ncbi:hypothetical protein F5148DRAFT_1316837 [Russula earlei]|uniref:Uncharacterized protein n=1 Tax=Russula earlei TaxID=71964 RepID=A0ACC0U381_9AGAM|nr:hypothetical protein F5148DRAFT_1316837 [Russula earlei]
MRTSIVVAIFCLAFGVAPSFALPSGSSVHNRERGPRPPDKMTEFLKNLAIGDNAGGGARPSSSGKSSQSRESKKELATAARQMTNFPRLWAENNLIERREERGRYVRVKEAVRSKASFLFTQGFETSLDEAFEGSGSAIKIRIRDGNK